MPEDMTLEEALERLKKQRARIAELEEEVHKTRRQAGGYRTARNVALKEAAAQAAVLKAHNIAFDASRADVSGYQIKDGFAVGEFKYEPPDPNKRRKAEPPKGGKPGALTFDDIGGMTQAELMLRYEDAVKAAAATPITKRAV